MIAIAIYIFGKRREIAAFTAQQVMTVAQEGIETMAPTIGNAAGEIAKGIKSGLNDVPTKNTNGDNNSQFEHKSESLFDDDAESSFGNSSITHSSNGMFSHNFTNGNSTISHHSIFDGVGVGRPDSEDIVFYENNIIY